MNQIDRFEALAKRLVEGTFTRLFASCLHPLEVATHLARAMEDHQVTAADGAPLAPTHYWIYVHPQDFALLANERPSLSDELQTHVCQLAREAGLTLTAPPSVAVEPLSAVTLHSVHVEARWQPSEPELGATREMTGGEQKAIQSQLVEPPPEKPFLIVGGERHVAVEQPVISLGRALDNDIILEDSRVSRHHAQLRRRYGRYVLYDVGSSGGTTINGYSVQECVLQPGDVISLAGVEVIYGEDVPGPSPGCKEGDTSEIDSDSPATGAEG
ncbi:MAG: FHA domain-containing protein [Anaerolineae bacterium]|nr:FHA domain-containing protein [Anaerolineae bacterium]